MMRKLLPGRAPWVRDLEDLPDVETVLAPVGGGGMISGIATAIKLSKPSVKIIGVEPELAADAQASLRAGQIIQFPAAQVTRTMADGSARRALEQSISNTSAATWTIS